MVVGKYFKLLITKTMENKRNQCKCGGIGTPSKAFLNTLVSFNDFGNDAGKRGTTQSRVGKAQLVDCIKCTSCGHSWIPQKSTRELALEQWNGLSENIQDKLFKNYVNSGKFTMALSKNQLTGSEIEYILLDYKPNQKQFKEFNSELFKAYIDKFSDEDKVRAMVVLLENQKEEYKFNCFLAALKQMNLDSNTHSNIMTLVALKDI